MYRARAWCLVRHLPPIRGESFAAGLAAAGLEVQKGAPSAPREGDVLVIWNRYGQNHEYACMVERAGGRVIVAENGYLSPGGGTPKFDLDEGMKPHHYIALARGGHNGAGEWPSGGPERFERLGVDLAPWRTGGEHILVCPNRAFGTPGYAMPSDWCSTVAKFLAKQTDRPVRVRAHPGTHRPKVPLGADLEGCWAMVIWSSSAGVHALAAGVPVVCDGRAWVLKGAASPYLNRLELYPGFETWPDRRPHFERMAWAQWTFAEIATGIPFRRLLEN